MNVFSAAGSVQLLLLLSGVSGIAMIWQGRTGKAAPEQRKKLMAGLRAGAERIAGVWNVRERLQLLRKRSSVRKEIAHGTAFLRNRIAASDQSRITADQMLTELLDQSRVLKHPYARMLSLLRVGESSSAVREFVRLTADPHAKEYAGMIIRLDELMPEQVYEDLSSLQRQLTEEQITAVRKRDEAVSNLLYLPVMANLLLIFFDFLYVAYFLQQKEMMGLLLG